MVQEDGADPVGGKGVDEVPPRSRLDEVPVEGERMRVLPLAGGAVPGEGQRGIPLLTVGRRVPEGTDGRIPLLPGRRRERRIGEQRSEQGSELRVR